MTSYDSNNSDLQELNKFEESSSYWWDPQGPFKPLHIINPVRLDYIDRHTQLKGKSVLDVGCGGGLLSEAMAEKDASVCGIDLGQNAIEIAQLHLHISQQKVDYQVISAEQLADSEENKYDVVTCMELLEHVPSPEKLIGACAKLAKPGGDIFFSTLNRNPIAYGFSILIAEYILDLLPKGTHNYQKFIKPSELANIARQHNLKVCDVSGIRYDPIGKNTRIIDSPMINYVMHCRKNK